MPLGNDYDQKLSRRGIIQALMHWDGESRRSSASAQYQSIYTRFWIKKLDLSNV